jgi:hypothetical protein
MNVLWIALGATAAVVTVVATIRRLVAVGQKPPAKADLGTVSDGWLSENRSRKDS